MKKKVVAAIAFLLGACALVYPRASDYLARINGSKIVQEYTKKITQLDSAEKSRIWAGAESYNGLLSSQPLHGFLLESAYADMSDEYRQALNIGGIMGYVDIPKLDIYLPIYHGTGDDALGKGAGHLEGSALPIGGISRHSVITGHSGLVHARMFTDLPALAVGDLFYIHVLGEVMAYEVGKISTIDPGATDELAPFDAMDYCTLMTCTPYGINSHRLLVRGERVAYSPEIKESIQKIPESGVDVTVVWAAFFTATMVMIMITTTITVSAKTKNQFFIINAAIEASPYNDDI